MKLTRILAGAALVAAFAFPSNAQHLGDVSATTVQTQLYNGQTTAAPTPNTNTTTNCVPTNGSPCAIPNIGQGVHLLQYSAPSCTDLDIRLEASFTGAANTFFAISQDATDVSPNPIGGITGVGAVTAFGNYPVIRANILTAAGGGCAVTAFYSGSWGSGLSTSGIAQQASPYRTPITINTVTSNAFTTIAIPTPYGSSGGSVWLQCSAACAAGGAVTVFAGPSDSAPIGSLVLINQSVGTVTGLQRFDVPAYNTSRVFVGLTPTAASANTWSVFYNFTSPGNFQEFANDIVGNTGHGIAPISCDNAANISTTASVVLVSGAAGKQIHICSISLVPAAADNVAVVEGTTGVCTVGTAGVIGGSTAATGLNLLASSVYNTGGGFGQIAQSQGAGNSLCLLVSAAVQLSGAFTWTQF